MDLGFLVFYVIIAIPAIWLLVRIGQGLARYGEWIFNATLHSLPLEVKEERARREITMNALTLFTVLMALSLLAGPFWDVLWFPTSVAGFIHTAVSAGIRKKYNLERGLAAARRALGTSDVNARSDP